jgi:FAD synthetase
MAPIGTIKKKHTTVLAAGVFDLLHLGHVRFLEEAKRAGGKNVKLIVIVARDETVEKKKGKKPVMSENQRRALVEALAIVDEAVLGYEKFNIKKVIATIRPNIVALGHDQKAIEEIVRKTIKKEDFKIRVVKIGQFSEEELNSSTDIKKKIIELHSARA